MKTITLILLFLVPTISFATATLNCNGEPYFFMVNYSLSEGAQSYELIKRNKTIKKGNVKKLTKFSLSWPETEQSNKNNISFSGKLENKTTFNGSASGDTGNLTVNKKQYRFKCEWLR